MNINENSYRPYIKPNDVPIYVHRLSNHPSTITRNIPLAVNKRLSDLSSSEEMFFSVKPIYQEALLKSGYNHKLEFNPTSGNPGQNKRNRQRKIIWFNPPFAKNVKTNIGRDFLKLVDKHFTQENPLQKIFNRKSVKISYR